MCFHDDEFEVRQRSSIVSVSRGSQPRTYRARVGVGERSPGDSHHARDAGRVVADPGSGLLRFPPLGTRAILTGCVGLYVLCVLVGYDAFHEVCMAPHWVLRGGEVHRVFTYAWFQGVVH